VDEVSRFAPIHPGEVLMEDFITPLRRLDAVAGAARDRPRN
jgi:hypothetical protein